MRRALDRGAMDEIDLRRLRWRCRRGMLENDLVLARFVERHAGSLDDARLAALNALLALPDPELWDLVSSQRECDDRSLAEVLAMLRQA